MWSAKRVSSKYGGNSMVETFEFDNNDANNHISYQKDFDSFGDIVGSGRIDRIIQAELDALERTAVYNANLATGPFTPNIPDPTPLEQFRAEVSHLQQVKQISDLGIDLGTTAQIKPVEQTADPLADAVSQAQALITPDIIDQL